jgi:hypothetical protein
VWSSGRDQSPLGGAAWAVRFGGGRDWAEPPTVTGGRGAFGGGGARGEGGATRGTGEGAGGGEPMRLSYFHTF